MVTMESDSLKAFLLESARRLLFTPYQEPASFGRVEMHSYRTQRTSVTKSIPTQALGNPATEGSLLIPGVRLRSRA